MKTERELFEVWVKKEHAHIFSGSEIGNCRFKMDVDFMFMAWQASSQREVYNLLPKYHKENIRDALIIACDTKVGEERFEDSLNYAHKAMIGDF